MLFVEFVLVVVLMLENIGMCVILGIDSVMFLILCVIVLVCLSVVLLGICMSMMR